MDFIEKIFGITPDAGSGTLEAAFVLAVAIIVAVALMLRSRAKNGSVIG